MPLTHQQEINAHYVIGCPDELKITVQGPAYSRTYEPAVQPDGRIDLGIWGRMRAEGLTIREVGQRVAEVVGAKHENVEAEIGEYRSKQVYIFGEVTGVQRAVAYQGQETVLDVLKRAGGITPGAEPDQVFLLRSNISSGREPEVFPVNLKDIVMKRNHKTNIRVEPFDQIYIGETRRASLQKVVPPLFHPLYNRLTGIHRRGQKSTLPTPSK